MNTPSRTSLVLLMVATACLLAAPARAQQELPEEPQPLGIAMEGYAYPYPVAYLRFETEGQDLRMAFMDVPPAGEGNGRAVLLFHGKNWFSAYWDSTIEVLTEAGYRVVAPDQVGFGKSSKPEIPYSFHRMGWHTKALLDTLGIDEVAVLGHSMGGMAAARFALMYPERVTHLILENPIGLEDYRIKVPYVPTEQIYESVLQATEENIRQDLQSYFVEWKPAYEEYVQAHYRQTLSGVYPRLAKASALTAQMIYEQPVVHEFPYIKASTLLVIGQEDRTALGKGRVSEEVQATLGQYPELGQRAAEAIPDARLVPLEGVGHVPHLAAPERFHEVLLSFLTDTTK